MSSHFLIWLYRYLWIAPHVLLLAAAIGMFRRRLYKDSPIFFAYILFDFLQFCLLFGAYLLNAPYYQVYVKIDLLGRAGLIALGFGVIQELFAASVAHSAAIRRDVTRVVNWAAAVLVVLALALIGYLCYTILARAFQAYLIVEALNGAQCGLIVLVFLWYRFLGLKMSPLAFGIALGMGLATGPEPAMVALKVSVTPRIGIVVDMVNMASYHCAVLIWLYSALALEKVTPDSGPVPLAQVREWAADLGRRFHL
jgi:hypothetical protein